MDVLDERVPVPERADGVARELLVERERLLEVVEHDERGGLGQQGLGLDHHLRALGVVDLGVLPVEQLVDLGVVVVREVGAALARVLRGVVGQQVAGGIGEVRAPVGDDDVVVTGATEGARDELREGDLLDLQLVAQLRGRRPGAPAPGRRAPGSRRS